ncbi:MAG: hypothetical protein IPP29_18480 [Bacteroidetes bacterium]|nr:hypothetical protein [Bacteroidota bacterium]
MAILVLPVVELGNQTEEIIVYPNPAFKELAISNAQANKAVIVNAYDVLGKQKPETKLNRH